MTLRRGRHLGRKFSYFSLSSETRMVKAKLFRAAVGLLKIQLLGRKKSNENISWRRWTQQQMPLEKVNVSVLRALWLYWCWSLSLPLKLDAGGAGWGSQCCSELFPGHKACGGVFEDTRFSITCAEF